MVIQIALTRGKTALIDDQDADLADKKWRALHPKGKHWYAARQTRKIKGKSHTISMHRIIVARMIDRELLRCEDVDHINHDGLDNRRNNIRLATMSQNTANMRKSKAKSSKYKGVSWNKKDKKWMVRIQQNGKQIYIGNFDSEEAAARAYDAAAKRFFLSFCFPNFSMKEAA